VLGGRRALTAGGDQLQKHRDLILGFDGDDIDIEQGI
jgi:hypothetical protein